MTLASLYSPKVTFIVQTGTLVLGFHQSVQATLPFHNTNFETSLPILYCKHASWLISEAPTATSSVTLIIVTSGREALLGDLVDKTHITHVLPSESSKQLRVGIFELLLTR
jgi:hypothetical protein